MLLHSVSHRICKGWFLLSLFILVSSACFCQFDPYAYLSTTHEPNTTDVVGTYVLKTQTLTNENLEFLQGKQATIEISTTGTFTTTNFPAWSAIIRTGYRPNKLLSVTGRWKIARVGSISNGGNNIKSVWGIHFSRDIDPANLTGDTPPYGLIFTYGDPDSGDVMIFERTE